MASPPRRSPFFLPTASVLNRLKGQSPVVLLESSLPSEEAERSYLFLEPVEIITTENPGEVQGCLERLDEAWRKGLWAAGYLSYEAGYCLEESLSGPAASGEPLLWWGIFDTPFVFDHSTGAFTPPCLLPGRPCRAPFPSP